MEAADAIAPGIPHEMVEAFVAYRRQRVKLARENVNTLAEFVIRDEETGAPIEQLPQHERWHEIANQHSRFVLWSYPESGKSTQLVVARSIDTLAHDPTRRIVICSDTEKQAKKPLGQIKQLIESSEALHEVHPNLRRGSKWTDTEITVQRPYASRDPSIQAVGLHGAIQGARIDDLYLDDILSQDNTKTEAQRKETAAWVRSTLFTRLTKRSRVIFLTNAWHPEDFAHLLEKDGWFVERCPIFDADGDIVDPQRWNPERLQEKRIDLGELEFARMFLLKPYDEGARRFHHSWINRCLQRGKGAPVYQELPDELPAGSFVVHGVDLGVGLRKRNDLTVIFSLFVHPNDDRQPLKIQAGRWKGSEIIGRMAGAFDAFGGYFMVENNAAQEFIVQQAQEHEVVMPVARFTTGKNKADPTYGLESLAAEEEAGRWIIPNANATCGPDTVHGELDEEIRAWVVEQLEYDPQAHTGDRLMGSWLARELARRIRRKLRKKQRRAQALRDAKAKLEAQSNGSSNGAGSLSRSALETLANVQRVS